MSTNLTGAAGTLPLPNLATVADPGESVTSADQQVTAQQLLNQDATLEAALPRNALVDMALVPVGGSALENLAVTGAGNPTLLVGATTVHGTASTVAVITGETVAAGDAIDAACCFDFIQATHATEAVAGLYATIGAADPVLIPGALFYITAGVVNTRSRMVMDGRLIAPGAGGLAITLYLFLQGSDDWQNLGGGSIRSRVCGFGI